MIKKQILRAQKHARKDLLERKDQNFLAKTNV